MRRRALHKLSRWTSTITGSSKETRSSGTTGEGLDTIQAFDEREEPVLEPTVCSGPNPGIPGNQDCDGRSSCEVCGNIITRECERLNTGTFPGVQMHYYSLSELEHKAAQGCPDCLVISNVAKAYNFDANFQLYAYRDYGRDPRTIFLQKRTREKYYLYRADERDGTAGLLVSQWSKIPQKISMSDETSSHEAYNALKKWLATCLSDHGSCSKETATSLPRRVLEIKESHVYLRDLHKAQGKYACLSHCWGSCGASLQLNSATIMTLKKGIPKSKLPKTFRDAAEICIVLDIRYLWIDAICIKQDDSDEWVEAAASMAEIYENAFITVAATWSDDSNGGCFARTREEYKLHKLGNTGLYAQTKLPSFPKRYEASKDEWPLLTRGWVLQERHLSPRIIHYARDQLFWECNSSFLSECGTNDWELHIHGQENLYYNHQPPLKRGSQYNLHASWRLLIENYTRLNFTKESDLLLALAGMAEHQMRLRPGDTYVAGMWKNSLLEDLLFKNSRGRRSNSNAPTWSWASWEGPVSFLWSGVPLPTLELSHFEYTYYGPSNVGQVSNARIRLKGPVLRAVIFHKTRSLSEGKVFWVSTSLFGACHNFAPEQAYTIMVMTECQHTGPSGVILSEVEEGVFERVGSVKLDFTMPGEGNYNSLDIAGNSFIDGLPIEELEII